MKIKLLVFTLILIFIFSGCSFNIENTKEAENEFSNSLTETIVETSSIETTTKKENKSITFSFLGDCMIASLKGKIEPNNMNWYLDNYDFSYFFEKTMPYISNDDFTIANCENVFTDTATKEITKNHSPAYWYRSSSKNANIFSKNSIDAVSIANNHINDYGNQGKHDTINALDKANVLWGNEENIIVLEKHGIKFGIIPVTFYSSWYVDSIVELINSVEEYTDIQIIYFHGGTERIHKPENWKIEGCRKFVDEGADLILGSHPHVLQPLEKYNNVNIVYSLGNFCYGGNRSPENRTIIYQHTFTFDTNKNLISSTENIIPFYVFTGSTNNWQPAPIEDENIKKSVLDFMYEKINSLF